MNHVPYPVHRHQTTHASTLPRACLCALFPGGDSSSAAGRDSPSVEKQKKRTPAWCDRILWLPDRQIYQLAYGRGEVAVRQCASIICVLAAFLLARCRPCVFLPQQQVPAGCLQEGFFWESSGLRPLQILSHRTCAAVAAAVVCCFIGCAVQVSDHRPVAAAFLLQAHRYRRDTVNELAESARRAVDMSSNAARPR